MRTVSLEVAKKLKAAGWYSHCYLSWVTRGDMESELMALVAGYIDLEKIKYYYAPTLGELMRALPLGFALYRSKDNKWLIIEDNESVVKAADTPEDAAALAWIALQEGEK